MACDECLCVSVCVCWGAGGYDVSTGEKFDEGVFSPRCPHSNPVSVSTSKCLNAPQPTPPSSSKAEGGSEGEREKTRIPNK